MGEHQAGAAAFPRDRRRELRPMQPFTARRARTGEPRGPGLARLAVALRRGKGGPAGTGYSALDRTAINR